MRFSVASRVTALVFSALSSLLSAAETLRLGADQWMPFNGEPSSDQPGYVIELARAVFAPHGITIDYRVVPWGDALRAAEQGELDGVIGANQSEAAKLLLPAESIGEPRVALWVRKNETWRYENLRSLLKIRLGVVADYKYWDSFDEYVAKQDAPRVTHFSGETPLKDALQKLRTGEIDAVPETLPVFAWCVKAAGLPSTDFQKAYLHEGEPVYLALSPAHPRAKAYAHLWDEGIRALRKSGELSRILARYGQRDWRE